MFFLSFLLLLVPLVSSTSRHSTSRMHKMHARSVDTTVISGKWDTINAGQYSLSNDLWNEQTATWGYQQSHLTSLSGSNIAWTTTYTWEGAPNQVKSFANIQLDTGVDQQLNAISSMPTTWEWSLSDNGQVVGDVAYDLFTSYSSGGSNVNEIMIWLANVNSGPISAQYNAEGHAVPIVTNISLEGYTWLALRTYTLDLTESTKVYSYLLTSGTVESFSGDIYPFFSYLIDNNYVSSTQYLTCAQAGTEATSGSAQFTTYAYSLAIN
ncbi:glycoside hydrolase family 12 protein [Suillus subalutaceus]|uniref:glycoside hydrolase family 12 protein n=1 Tax=Suillus subalutaceus TaxID=48586 RepID=UPI001B88427E|nr:glycoside hydrolase family 12 protein [Suillus subalutaceus]KAG1845731.1 glycoside hydrolase family 12 protein [Suillus subalutaceus]